MPHLMAALVLAVAGIAKLRAPQAAAAAVELPVALIRGFAAGEVGLAAVAALAPSAWISVLMAVLYAGFALLTLRLASRGAACGCFGAGQDAASPGQSLLSGALAGVAALGVVARPHTLAWLLGRPAASVAVLLIGSAAAVYGIVLAYSELPQLWRSWRPA